ncbi:MAG: DNA-protecting protein DprA [Deltaproteobacteria bacterium]|nr:DNA-protecting protein DprA [Deltaproteobacteria bacterium]
MPAPNAANDHRLALSALDAKGVGPVTARRLIAAFGSAEHVFGQPVDLLVEAGAPAGAARAIVGFDEWDRVAAAKSTLAAIGARVISIDDDDYPTPLRALDDAPLLLYVLGEWQGEDHLAVAMVGTRNPTDYGLRTARSLAREFAGASLAVVSGLALGIDTACHEGALAAPDGRTLAVLGSGIDNITPRSNAGLARMIADGRGAVMTEFFPGMQSFPQNFPRRNRLISGLSMGVVVIEAGEKSGTLHTVDYANRQGKPVFALPGPIDSPASRGTNALIRDGAPPVTEAMDVIAQILPEFARRERVPTPPRIDAEHHKRSFGLTGEPACVLEALSLEPRHIDDLAGATGLPAQRLLTILLELELRGAIRARPGGHYVLNL